MGKDWEAALLVFKEKGIKELPRDERGTLAYVDAIREFPFIKSLKREGALTGVFYAPTAADKLRLLEVDAEALISTVGAALAFTLPWIRGGPQKIVLTELFFKDGKISSNNEAICSLLHEHRHVIDAFWKIRFPHVDEKVENTRVGFGEIVSELRAYHAEIEAILDGLLVSPFYLRRTEAYFRQYMEDARLTQGKFRAGDARLAATERKIWRAQTDEFGDFEATIKEARRMVRRANS